MPATSALVADALSVRCGSFDLNAACAGFAYATIVGGSLVQASGGGVPLVSVVAVYLGGSALAATARGLPQ